MASFSPRNGEVILKLIDSFDIALAPRMFQSPQWGSNSKVMEDELEMDMKSFQSPQWGSNSKVLNRNCLRMYLSFSPRNGEVILKQIVLDFYY